MGDLGRQTAGLLEFFVNMACVLFAVAVVGFTVWGLLDMVF